MYTLIENNGVKQYPYTFSDLKRANPQVSFPENMTDESLQSYGVYRVFPSAQPSLSATQVLEESTPAFDAEAQRWTQVWRTCELTADEMQQRNDAKAAEVRAQRNAKLSITDWTQVADAPVDKAVWAAYRQALRDVTAQQGFPWEIDWPKQP